MKNAVIKPTMSLEKLVAYISPGFLMLSLIISVITLLTVNRLLGTDESKDVSIDLTDENNAVMRLIESGEEDKVYEFYDKLVRDKKLTYLIVSSALINDIPISYFMSLGYTESKFNQNALNKNVDSSGNLLSYDYGVFQLNSKSYPDYDKDYLMKVENNVRMAAKHLRTNYDKYGNWYEAVLSYNAGNTEFIKNRTVQHLVSVLTLKEQLLEDFKMEF